MSDTAKKAVFVFTTAYYPLVGGAEVAIQEVQERLHNTFDFFIFTARMRRDIPRRENGPGGEIVIRVGFGYEFDKWLLIMLAPWAALRERRKNIFLWGMDISQGSAAAAIFTLLRSRTPFLLTIQYGYGGQRLHSGRFGLIGLAYRFMLGRATQVSAISSFLAQTTRNFGFQGNVEIIPNGASIKRFGKITKKKFDPVHPVVITTSRLVPKNGVDTLIRAIFEVRKQIPGVTLVIAGDGPDREELEALRDKLGLGEQITFLGSIPNEKIPNQLSKADIFVRMSRSEGLGISFIEAMAAGLPVIGTSVEGIPDVIHDGETGLFARVDDPEDCSEKILLLCRNVPLLHTLAEKGKRLAEEKFSWTHIAGLYERMFAKDHSLRLLIATPMFPPDIGGPGTYAEWLAQALIREGHRVQILSYGKRRHNGGIPVVRVSSRIPSGLRHVWYALRAWSLLGVSDVVLVLDPVIVGLPVAVARIFRKRPMIMRNEGDFLWEWYLERTQTNYTLRDFNQRFPYAEFTRKEKMMYRIACWVFPQADKIVFNSKWREDIFRIRYPLRPNQSEVIYPALEKPTAENEREQVLYFVGRFTRVKNIPRLIRSFLASADDSWRLELIGEGPEKEAIASLIQEAGASRRVAILAPLRGEALRKKIKSAYALLLPSLSDVSPNIILECVREGTPFLLTQETGFREEFREEFLFVNPLDEDDLKAKIKLLLDPSAPSRYRAYFQTLQERPWSVVAEEWLALMRPNI